MMASKVAILGNHVATLGPKSILLNACETKKVREKIIKTLK